MKKEKEIDLLDMLMEIFKHYKVIVAVSVILMIVAGGANCINQIKTNKAIENSSNEVVISEEELTALNEYHIYESIYNAIKSDNENDKSLSVDYSKIQCLNIIYLISDSNDADMLANLYKNMLVVDEKTFGEMYKASSVEIINSTKSNELHEEYNNSLILIEVYGESDEQCLEYAEKIKANVDTIHDSLLKKFKEHSIETIFENIKNADVQKMTANQRLRIKSELDAYIEMDTVSKKVSEKALSYNENNNELSENKRDVSISIVSIVKYAGVGFLAGVAILFCIYGAFYIVSDTIKFADNYEELFGINVLGIVGDKKKKNVLKRIIRNIQCRNINVLNDEAVDMISAGIKANMEKSEYRKIYIAGCNMSSVDKDFVNQMSISLKENEIELIVGDSILCNAGALEESIKIGNIIIMEKLGLSKREEIYKEFNKVKEYNLNLVGMVIIE